MTWANFMLKILSRLCAVSGLVVVFASFANAQLEIEITRGGGSRTPVAVVPFGWKGSGEAPPFDVSALISADLYRSGRFDPIGSDKMLQHPTGGIDVDFDDWSVLGVEGVVVGSVEQTGENAYFVKFELFDVYQRKQLVGYRMPASRGTPGHRTVVALPTCHSKATDHRSTYRRCALETELRYPVVPESMDRPRSLRTGGSS